MNEAEKCMQRIRSGENLPRITGVTIDDLPQATAAELTDFFEIQKGNESKKITLQQIADKIGGNAGGTSASPFNGLDSTGNTNVTAEFQRIINDNIGKTLYVPDGVFWVDSLNLPSKTKIIGGQTFLKQKTLGNMFSIGVDADNIWLESLILLGLNSADRPSTIDGEASRGIYINGSLRVCIKDLFISGFGAGIEWSSTGYNAKQKYNYVANISNVNIEKCYYGLRANTRGEFFNIVGCRAGLCVYGAWIGGGNNMMANCQFNNNNHGAYLTGNNMDNHGHGSFTGCQFNHNRGGKSIWFNGVNIGYMVSSCQFFDGQILIEGNTKGVIFSACEGGKWTIQDDTPDGYDNLMMGCYFYERPGGNWAATLKNQYNIGTGARFEPASSISANELIDIRYDKKLRGKLNGTINSAGGGFVYYVDLSTVIADSTYIYAIIVRVTNYTSTATVNAEAYFVDSLSNKVREIIPYTQVYQSGDSVYLLFKVDKVIPQNTMIGAAVERAGGANTFGMAYTSEQGTPRYSFGSGKLASGQNVSATAGNINVEIGYLVKY